MASRTGKAVHKDWGLNGRTLFFVAAGMLVPKKEFGRVSLQHRYLNYGALGLATKISVINDTVRLYHGNFDAPNEFFRKLLKKGLDQNGAVLISLPSYYSVSWVKAFIDIVDREFPSLPIIVGGRWVIDPDVKWIRDKLGDGVWLVRGDGENALPTLFGNYLSEGKQRILDYSLLDNAHQYCPSVEISRGCGMGCEFCADASTKRERNSSPLQVLEQISNILTVYGVDETNMYFEAPLFTAGINWADGLGAALRENGLTIPWRCEARVDSFTPRAFNSLRVAGLSVIDLGLESGSVKQLEAMGKTKNGRKYLDKAESLLRLAASLGVKVKVNVLLYPGENSTTIDETQNWLERNRDFISGVSVSPVTVYGSSSSAKTFLKSISALGASLVCEETFGKTGIGNLNLSHSMPYQASKDISLALSREFMTAFEYHELKAFSYFKRGYGFSQFMRDVRQMSPELLPFRTT